MADFSVRFYCREAACKAQTVGEVRLSLTTSPAARAIYDASLTMFCICLQVL
jgi:hypothetical protein